MNNPPAQSISSNTVFTPELEITTLSDTASSASSQDTEFNTPTAKLLHSMLAQSKSALRPKVEANLSPQDAEEFVGFMDRFEELDANNVEQLYTQCARFVEANVDNPDLIVHTLGYLNGQGMVLRGTEIQLNANKEHSQDTLKTGVRKLLNHSESSGHLHERLGRITVEPVFTAHPTNLSRPQASSVIHQAELVTMDVIDHNMYDSLHQNQGPREKKPTVRQEAEGYRAPIKNIHKATHRVHKSVNSALNELGEKSLESPLVSVGNWVAGDRDGNPYVTANVLREVAGQHADTALANYAYKLSDGKNRLTNGLMNGNERLNLRTLLSLAGQDKQTHEIATKIQTTRANVAAGRRLASFDGYSTPESLIADLKKLDFGLLSPEEKKLAETKRANLILDIKTGGFHGATTDIRQNSAINEKTVSALLTHAGIESNYEQLSEPKKQALLKEQILNGDLKIDLAAAGGDAALQQELELIATYKDIHNMLGKEALGNCITANTETVSDLLEVCLLLKAVGVASDHHLDMNVVGLIETVTDLENATKILGGLFEFDWYRQNLQSQDKPQMVMVGYSDSARLDGSISSNWAVYKGTQEMMETAKSHDIDLLFFHGRGGSEGRGAGANYREEIAVHDGTSLNHGFRQTEQGEEVGDKFGQIDVATANLGDMLGTTLSKTAEGADRYFHAKEAVMDELAKTGRETYGKLYNHEETPDFYQNSTPIEFIGLSNAGSRPAKRSAKPGEGLNLEKLRAIPWTAGWMQLRANVPAFFGTGTALKAFTETGKPIQDHERVKELREMYNNWPFFTNLVDRTELALAKADMDIVEMYTPDRLKNGETLDMIRQEYRETARQINKIKGQVQLLSKREGEEEKLSVRNKVTNRANAMQAALLSKFQQLNATDNPHEAAIKENLKGPIVVSMQAVANGLGRFG